VIPAIGSETLAVKYQAWRQAPEFLLIIALLYNFRPRTNDRQEVSVHQYIFRKTYWKTDLLLNQLPYPTGGTRPTCPEGSSSDSITFCLHSQLLFA